MILIIHYVYSVFNITLSLIVIPLAFVCNDGEVYCDGQCIHEYQVCDGKRHCQSGEDEINCGTNILLVFYLNLIELLNNVFYLKHCYECNAVGLIKKL